MNRTMIVALSLILASADGDSWLSIAWSMGWLLVALSQLRKELYDRS